MLKELEMELEKYKIADEVKKEWRATYPEISFSEFLKMKMRPKPKHPLFERFKGYLLDVGDELVSDEKKFVLLLRHFKDEFNGTRGLDEAIDHFDLGAAEDYESTTVSTILKEIKSELENN